jgi:hypothetical protein
MVAFLDASEIEIPGNFGRKIAHLISKVLRSVSAQGCPSSIARLSFDEHACHAIGPVLDPNWRVERFCSAEMLHFDEIYIIAKNSSFWSGTDWRMHCFWLKSDGSQTQSSWLILVTRLWNLYVICELYSSLVSLFWIFRSRHGSCASN